NARSDGLPSTAIMRSGALASIGGDHDPGQSDAQLVENMKRRTFARYLALVGGIGFLGRNALSAAFDNTIGVDDTLADRLDARSIHYMQQWDTIPPHILLA